MIKINNAVLKAYTLGRFLVRKEEHVISKERKDSLNLWLLFQYLLSHPNTLVSRKKIIDELNFDMKLIDAKNALENRIYRLRKLLAVGEQYQTDKYIIYEQGKYGLNWNRTCWSDSIEFENKCEKGRKFLQEKQKQAALDKLIKALEVYKGDYLKNLDNYQWVITRRVKYQEMYQDIFEKTCEILTELGDYQTIEKLCRHAIEIDPFYEQAHYILIKTLLKQGDIKSAKSQYNITRTYFDKQKEEPFPELNKIIKKKQKKQYNMQEEISQKCFNLNKIKEDLNLNTTTSGINFVEKRNFRRICQDKQQKCQKQEVPLFLASIILKFNKNEISKSQKNEFIEDLKSTLKNKMRKSDIICQWNRKQFLILLTSIRAKKVQLVLKRLKNKFYQLEEETGSIMKSRYCKL